MDEPSLWKQPVRLINRSVKGQQRDSKGQGKTKKEEQVQHWSEGRRGWLEEERRFGLSQRGRT